MKIQLIRNATMRILYGGRQILTDPMLSEKHEIESFAGVSPNPVIDMPVPVSQVLEGIEAVFLSHLHQDHFDLAAQGFINKGMKIFCQPVDVKRLKDMGFLEVNAVEKETQWGGIAITRTGGQHGTGKWEKEMGNVSGFVFKAAGEPVIYWAGDTILNEIVEQVIETFDPDIIITHSCGAKFPDSDPIIMDAQQTIDLSQKAPKATIVAVHMESLDHASVNRSGLRSAAVKAGISEERLQIPNDGEILEF